MDLDKIKEFMQVFFWNYKRMDNVNYNFKILDTLFSLEDKNVLLNKPKIILIASIIECILYDLILRLREERHERSSWLVTKIDRILHTRERENVTSCFNNIIAHIKKHDYLEQNTNNEIYSKLEKMLQYRNRLHIQNAKNQLGRDEENDHIWSDAVVNASWQLLQDIVIILCQHHERPGRDCPPINEFPNPYG